MLSDEERERTAYHESGHAVLGMLEPGADPVRKISIVPARARARRHVPEPRADRYGYDARYLEGRIIGALGGRAAEELVYGNVTTGAESDLEQVTQHRPPDGRPLGHVRRHRARVGAPGAGRGAVLRPRRARQVAEATRELVDREVRRIVDDCYDRARRALRRQPRQARVAGAGAARARDARRGRRLPRRRLRARQRPRRRRLDAPRRRPTRPSCRRASRRAGRVHGRRRGPRGRRRAVRRRAARAARRSCASATGSSSCTCAAGCRSAGVRASRRSSTACGWAAPSACPTTSAPGCSRARSGRASSTCSSALRGERWRAATRRRVPTRGAVAWAADELRRTSTRTSAMTSARRRRC